MRMWGRGGNGIFYKKCHGLFTSKTTRKKKKMTRNTADCDGIISPTKYHTNAVTKAKPVKTVGLMKGVWFRSLVCTDTCGGPGSPRISPSRDARTPPQPPVLLITKGYAGVAAAGVQSRGLSHPQLSCCARATHPHGLRGRRPSNHIWFIS